MASNPILPGHWADPFVFKDGNDYYLYPTKDDPDWASTTFHAFHSRDLQRWSGPFEILSLADVAWAKTGAWAPSVGRIGDTYYLYFVAECQIGVAAAASPTDRFVDLLGRPLIGTNAWGCQSIDPDLFIDADGQPYLLWGQGKCWIVPLADDLCSFKHAPVCLSDQLYTQRGLDPRAFDQRWADCGQDPYAYDVSLYNEGAHLQQVDGRYLLSWSTYDACDVRYQVRYAWADQIYGPYVMPPENSLLLPTDAALGTGHATLTTWDGSWHLFYHRLGANGNCHEREICCDQLRFERGNPLCITPT